MAVAAFAVVGINRITDAAPILKSASVVLVELADSVTLPFALIFPSSRLLSISAISRRCSSSFVCTRGTRLYPSIIAEARGDVTGIM